MLMCVLVMAAVAAGDDQGIVAKGTIAVGSGVVTAILTWLSAKRGWAEKEQKLRAEIANELRTKIVNDPLHVELCKDYVSRSEFQTFVEGNEKEHNNIFLRLTANDHQMGEVKGLLTGIREDLTLIKSKIFGK